MRALLPSLRVLVVVLAVVLVGGCAKSGMGDAVRTDVTARMQATAPTISDCYRQALRENRKLRGMIVVAFVAAAQTGAFQDVQIVRDDLQHPDLDRCIVDAVAAQKLATPQKTNLSIEYPLDFAPTK